MLVDPVGAQVEAAGGPRTVNVGIAEETRGARTVFDGIEFGLMGSGCLEAPKGASRAWATKPTTPWGFAAKNKAEFVKFWGLQAF